jgi:hypothetical protein
MGRYATFDVEILKGRAHWRDLGMDGGITHFASVWREWFVARTVMPFRS